MNCSCAWLHVRYSSTCMFEENRSISTNLETRITRISHCHALIARNRDRIPGSMRESVQCISFIYVCTIDRIAADRLLQILTRRESGLWIWICIYFWFICKWLSYISISKQDNIKLISRPKIKLNKIKELRANGVLFSVLRSEKGN